MVVNVRVVYPFDHMTDQELLLTVVIQSHKKVSTTYS